MEEFITSLIGYKLSNATNILRLLKFLPVDYNMIKRVITSFNNLHFDKETGILYSLPALRLHELRGPTKLIAYSEIESIALVTLAASIAETNSVLDILLDDYIVVKETRKKGKKTYRHFYDYLLTVFSNNNKFIALQSKVTYIFKPLNYV